MIPAHLVKDQDLMLDLDTTFALLRYCEQPAFRPVRLSNSQKINPHGEKVIAIIKEQCKEGEYGPLEEFIRMWRLDFLESMKPKYLPRGWSIEHKMQRTFGENSIFKS